MALIINLTPYILEFAVACFINALLVNSVKWFGADKKFGIQKYHRGDISRLGGLSIALSISVGILFLKKYHLDDAYLACFLMIAFFPIFIGGLIEDVTHKVKPKIRFILACISSLAVILITRILFKHSDVRFIQVAMMIPGFSLIITMLVIVGFLNSINIIDGFHGVASGSTLIMLTAIAAIAYQVEDYLLFRITLIIFVANFSFLIWNWPFGKLFLGDSGAYLLGIWVAELGILLQSRTTNISPLAPLLIFAYPMIETLFTIYRRKIIKNKAMSQPDASHLHTIIYRRYFLKRNIIKTNVRKDIENSKVALTMWSIVLFDCIIALYFFEDTVVLFIAIISTLLIYLLIYKLIVNFKGAILFGKIP